MKRFIKIAAMLLALLTLSATAGADMLIEPGDSFGDAHMDECTYLYRRYVANGGSGYVTIWKSPVSSQQNRNVANGTELGGGWHYEDTSGETWLCVWSIDDESSQDDPFGWVKESECVAVYDYISFQNEHGDEFYEADCTVYDENFAGADSVTCWSYPNGAAEYAYDGEKADDFREHLDYVSSCWDDNSGRTWGYVGYFQGYKSFWVCLSDPTFDGEPADDGDTEYPDAETETEADDGDAAASGSGNVSNDKVTLENEDKVELYPAADDVPAPESGVTVYVVAGVAAVVVVTLVLLWALFVKKKR